MISVEKPGSPSDVLEHFGKKGMRWGVRNVSDSRASSKAFDKKFPTAKARATEIHRARISVEKQKKKLETSRNPTERKAVTKAYLKNKDRQTALRTTRGEKVVGAILLTLAPTIIIPAATAGYSVSRVVRRKNLEKSQGK